MKLKWNVFKKVIPCNVSCRNEAYFKKKAYTCKFLRKKNLQKTTSPTSTSERKQTCREGKQANYNKAFYLNLWMKNIRCIMGKGKGEGKGKSEGKIKGKGKGKGYREC